MPFFLTLWTLGTPSAPWTRLVTLPWSLRRRLLWPLATSRPDETRGAGTAPGRRYRSPGRLTVTRRSHAVRLRPIVRTPQRARTRRKLRQRLSRRSGQGLKRRQMGRRVRRRRSTVLSRRSNAVRPRLKLRRKPRQKLRRRPRQGLRRRPMKRRVRRRRKAVL